ncbi:unnamed protein product [Urochloa humidicola]
MEEGVMDGALGRVSLDTHEQEGGDAMHQGVAGEEMEVGGMAAAGPIETMAVSRAQGRLEDATVVEQGMDSEDGGDRTEVAAMERYVLHSVGNVFYFGKM